MKTNLIDLYITNPLKACRLALRRTTGIAENDRLEAINKLLGGFGTEAIKGEWQNGYWGEIEATYVNKGDTYDLTIIRVRGESSFDNSRFIVSSWGDYMEKKI